MIHGIDHSAHCSSYRPDPDAGAPDGFFRLPTKAIRGAPRLPFAIHVRIEGEYVEYAPAQVDIDREAIEALEGAELDSVWVRVSDSGEFLDYTDSSIREVLRSDALDTYEKSAALQIHSAAATRHLLCTMPEAFATARRLDVVSEGMCEFLGEHDYSFARLMKSLGRDHDGFQHAARVAMYGLVLGRAVDGAGLAGLGVTLLLHNVLDLSPLPKNAQRVLDTAGPDATRVCLLHQERLDGDGPRGVPAEGLDPVVRLVAVACTFDRLTAAMDLPTFDAARTMINDPDGLDQGLTRTFIGLLAR